MSIKEIEDRIKRRADRRAQLQAGREAKKRAAERPAERPAYIDLAPQYPSDTAQELPRQKGWPKRDKAISTPTYRFDKGFSSCNERGKCEVCGGEFKNHPICQACGIHLDEFYHESSPCDLHGYTLCPQCRARWKGMDLIAQQKAGRDATFFEMLRGFRMWPTGEYIVSEVS